MHTGLYPDRAGKGLHVVHGTTICGLKHQPNFVCSGLLLRALGIRWLGSGKLRGRRDEKSTENPPKGYSLQHVPGNGAYVGMGLIIS